jgi:NADH:ubiquinone reductase (H+-translocating)
VRERRSTRLPQTQPISEKKAGIDKHPVRYHDASKLDRSVRFYSADERLRISKQSYIMAKRILIVGAGFAGMWSALSAARLLDMDGKKNGSVEIALIAPEPSLHVRPRLYEIGSTTMKVPLGDIFNEMDVRFIEGRVRLIHTARSEVTIVSANGDLSDITYDRLVLAAGSRLFTPAIPGLFEYSFNVDQIEGAAALEAHIESLGTLSDGVARNTVVVAGGGFTGIETAAELPRRLRAVFGDTADVNVIIVEQAAEIGPDLGPGPRPVIAKALGELGIVYRVSTSVTAMDAGGIWTSTGERIESRTVIWTAGARANALTEQIPGERDRFGRLYVDRNLRAPHTSGIFAAGDVARAETDNVGHHAAMSCQHAMALGRYAGHNAAADLLGAPMLRYSQPKYVTCLDLGRWGAVYTEGWDRKVKFVGMQAKLIKQKINTKWIYPPRADRAEILVAADPERIDAVQ